MKSLILIINFIFLTPLSYAQNNELLKIKGKHKGVFLESLKINIRVLGNIATTTTEMTFYNPINRVLEGELSFPLAEGQKVFRYALDINGKLREGVCVEKTLGRKAFEGVVRQNIDPGLLEMTEGNNYKTRIYPIPAKGRKRVVIGYEEELKNTRLPLYQLILNYGKVKDFELKIEVINQELKPNKKPNQLVNFEFEKWNEAYIAEKNEENFKADGVLSFEIPTDIKEKVYREKKADKDFFYVTFNPKVKQVNKELPASITLIWDVSKSGYDRDLPKEIALLEKYLSKLV